MSNSIHGIGRRVGATFLCLIFLCGTIMSTVVFPSAETQKAVKKFTADFSELVQLVQESGKSFTGGRYLPGETDSAINAWISERFSLYYARESFSAARSYLGQPSTAFDTGDRNTWGGTSWWEIGEEGTLFRHTDQDGDTATNDVKTGGEMLRKADLLIVKDAFGEKAKLRNFVAEYTVTDPLHNKGAVVLLFRGNTENGIFGWDWDTSQHAVNNNQQMVMVGVDDSGNTGISVMGARKAVHYTQLDTYLNAMNSVSAYKVTVRVVADKCTVTITSADGNTTYHTAEYALTIQGKGELAIGVTNTEKGIKDFTVTQLNNNGNPVDFGTDKIASEYDDGTKRFIADFAELRDVVTATGKTFTNGRYMSVLADDAINTWVNDKFALYYEREELFVARGYLGQPSTAFDTGDRNTWGGTSWWEIGSDGTLVRRTDQDGDASTNDVKTGGEMLRKADTLVVKSADGKAAQLKNFVAEYTVSDALLARGATVLSFRNVTKGNISSRDKGTYGPEIRADQQLVVIGTDENGDIGISIISTPQTAQYKTLDTKIDSIKTVNEYKVCVEVVDDKCTVTVTTVDGLTQYYKSAATPLSIAEAGHLSLSVTNTEKAIGYLVVTELDENGNKVDFGTTTVASAAPSYTDDTVRFEADFSELQDMADDAGYAFPNGAYLPTETDTVTAQWINSRFALYYNRESFYTMRGYLAQFSSAFDTTEQSNWGGTSWWEIGNDGTLRRHTDKDGDADSKKDVQTGGEMLRKADMLVVKTADGTPAKLKNFVAEYAVTDTLSAKGAVVLSFRNDSKGFVENDSNSMYADQQAVIIGVDGTGKAGVSVIGTAASADFTTLRTYVDALDGTNKYKVVVRVVNDVCTVTITSMDGIAYYTSADMPLNIQNAGYLAIGVTNTEKALNYLTVTELDDQGQTVDFGTATETVPDYTDGKVRFEADFSELRDEADEAGALYVRGRYASTEADAAINEWIDKRFDLYYTRESVNSDRAYLGQPSSVFDADDKSTWGGTSWWEVYVNGLLIRRTDCDAYAGTYDVQTGGEMLRKADLLLPKTSDGAVAQLTNFIAEYTVDDPLLLKGATILTFRNSEKGNFFTYDGGQTFRNACSMVVVGIDNTGNPGISVIGTAAQRDATHYTTLDTYVDALRGVTAYKVSVKVLNDSCTVTITSLDGKQTYYTGTAPLDVTAKGYLAFGVTNTQRSLGKVTVTALDDFGNVVDFGCPWDITTDGYSADMDTTVTDVEQAYDFYYHGVQNGNVVYAEKEPLSAHWQLNGGLLIRQNDLSENITEQVTMLNWKQNGEAATLRDLDATFAVNVGSAQQGAFWVTARTDSHGKVVMTPGGTDFVESGVAVGLHTNGNVIIANGNGGSVTVTGNAALADGTHTLRVRLYDNVLEVYVDGTLRATRTVATEAMEAGYLSFGCSGATFGIGGVNITRLDANGVAVDMETIYKSVQSFAPIMVEVGSSANDLILPEQVLLTKNDDTTETADVWWNIGAIDFGTVGDAYIIGYLKQQGDNGAPINGIHAVIRIEVGLYDKENTTRYTFSENSQLDMFDAWYMYTTNRLDQPAVHVKNTANDNWYLSGGQLIYKKSALFKDAETLQNGFEENNTLYQETRGAWAHVYASNFGIAVLKAEYENFILEVDVRSNTGWSLVGFGAEATDALSVFPSHKNGGYAFYVEQSGSSGIANLWGYDPETGAVGNLQRASVSPYTVDGTMHHYTIIVADGVARFYLDDIQQPLQMTLPTNYDGGHIYLAVNNEGAGFDNLKITDLDAKDILLETSAVIPNATIDRAASQSLGDILPGLMYAKDANGYTYPLPVEWTCDTYRSYIQGDFTFAVKDALQFAGVNTAALTATLTVTNDINGDFDIATSRKYYFDHPNDLEDFLCQYSKEAEDTPTEYWSAYDGELISCDPSEKWKISNGVITPAYTHTPNDGFSLERAQGISTMLLEDLNLINYRVEMDYLQGINYWYCYMLLGVQDPNSMYAVWDLEVTGRVPFQYNTDLGAGLWTFIEREGRLNMWNVMRDTSELQFDRDKDFSTDSANDFNETYDPNKAHHMVVDVYNGVMTIRVDGIKLYEDEISSRAIGGYVGFGNHGNAAHFDNFQITALDAAGNPVDFANAESGCVQEAPVLPDVWKPADDWQWGPEYE